MAEHWKSTPKYYCKPCLTYVRDTPLERTNHEATGKHKGAIRRALGNLHRAANTAQREQDQARREIDRVNGVVNSISNPSSSSSNTSRASGSGGGSGGSSEAERARQAAQLAALGVAPPAAFRGDLAMPGEWSVTSTTIVDDDTAAADGKKTGGGGSNKLKARGVHKRERTDAEREHEAAVEGLFKRPRKWGRDTRLAGGEESGELDALLSGGLELGVKKEEGGKEVAAKIEAGEEEQQDGRVKEEEGAERLVVKEEPVVEDANSGCIPADVPVADVNTKGPGADLPRGVENKDGEAGSGATADAPVVVAFKKRKPKNIRQR